MPYEVTLYDVQPYPGDGYARCPTFMVRRPDGKHIAVFIGLTGTASAMLAMRLGGSHHDADITAKIDMALVAFGAIKTENEAISGTLDSLADSAVHEVIITSNDDELESLVDLIRTKECSYQVESEGDLFCSAASQVDEQVVGTIGLRRIAPTTGPVCIGCNMPDARLVCSHLAHPAVWSEGGMGSGAIPPRTIQQAACERNQPEIADPGGCRPGGNPCWSRVIETGVHVASQSPPRSLADALDFLDSAWQLRYGAGILNIKSVADVVGLASACSSREDFKSRVSELDDLIKNFVIADAALPAETTIPADQTLNRLEAIFGAPPLSDTVAPEAIKVLRTVSRIRVGYQHTDAAAKLQEHFRALGIENAALDWPTTWDTVRSVTADALILLARALRSKNDPPATTPETNQGN